MKLLKPLVHLSCDSSSCYASRACGIYCEHTSFPQEQLDFPRHSLPNRRMRVLLRLLSWRMMADSVLLVTHSSSLPIPSGTASWHRCRGSMFLLTSGMRPSHISATAGGQRWRLTGQFNLQKWANSCCNVTEWALFTLHARSLVHMLGVVSKTCQWAASELCVIFVYFVVYDYLLAVEYNSLLPILKVAPILCVTEHFLSN